MKRLRMTAEAAVNKSLDRQTFRAVSKNVCRRDGGDHVPPLDLKVQKFVRHCKKSGKPLLLG